MAGGVHPFESIGKRPERLLFGVNIVLLLFVSFVCICSCTENMLTEIKILQPIHESILIREASNFTNPLVIQYEIHNAYSCNALENPSIFIDGERWQILVSGIELNQTYNIDFAHFNEGPHEIRVVLPCAHSVFENVSIFEIVHRRYPFDAERDGVEQCLLNASQSPYPFMHIFHGSWAPNPQDPLQNYQEGDIIMDIGANIGEHALRMAADHPLAEIHAYEVIPVLHLLAFNFRN
jgi:hypothetical protein